MDCLHSSVVNVIYCILTGSKNLSNEFAYKKVNNKMHNEIQPVHKFSQGSPCGMTGWFAAVF